MSEATIIQTAKDYDMTLYEVERIARLYTGDEFYERLEEFIKNRVEN